MTTYITRDELRSVLDAVTVVDAVPPAPYGQRHLPGALNLVEEARGARLYARTHLCS
jgi:hypothetical protein